MADQKTIEDSRHYFRNCKAAFRLLQGALLSGHYKISESRKSELESKMVTLEKGVYNSSDASLNDVQSFFLGLDELIASNKSKAMGISPVKLEHQKIIVIDDEYETCGWKEVFELIFPSESIIPIKDFKTAEQRINHIKSSVIAVIVDINMGNKKESSIESDGKEGFQLIKSLSENYPQIPIIAFSAYESAIIAKKAFEDGAWDYFAKEPKTEEVKEYRNSLDYYFEFIGNVQKYQQYNKNYIQYWNMIDGLEEQMNLKLPADFGNNILKNLRSAYMYLCMEEMIRFTPSIWDVNKTEMVISQAAKAMETLCAHLINHYNLPALTEDKPTFGRKIRLMEDNISQTKIIQSWIVRISKLNRDRNTSIHETEYIYSKKKFIVSRQIDEAVGKDFFVKAVHIIKDGLQFIPNPS